MIYKETTKKNDIAIILIIILIFSVCILIGILTLNMSSSNYTIEYIEVTFPPINNTFEQMFKDFMVDDINITAHIHGHTHCGSPTDDLIVEKYGLTFVDTSASGSGGCDENQNWTGHIVFMNLTIGSNTAELSMLNITNGIYKTHWANYSKINPNNYPYFLNLSYPFQSDSNITVLFFGDSQIGTPFYINLWDNITSEIAKNYTFKYAWALGDLISDFLTIGDENNIQYRWDKWWEGWEKFNGTIRNFNRSILIGNHDTYWGVNNNNHSVPRWYNYTIGNILFIVLSDLGTSGTIIGKHIGYGNLIYDGIDLIEYCDDIVRNNQDKNIIILTHQGTYNTTQNTDCCGNWITNQLISNPNRMANLLIDSLYIKDVSDAYRQGWLECINHYLKLMEENPVGDI